MIPALTLVGALLSCVGHGRDMAVVVDFAENTGVLRPLHGVNNGPSNTRGGPDLGRYFTAAGIPSCRLHDVPHSGSHAVDISAVFPLAHADPDDPRNYRFERTDDYIAGIVRVGSEIVYRLGNSIEHSARKYDVHPPEDPEKWARVCVNIIRHYNEGWADGFHHGIRYWEIWNEPDLGAATWTGTREEYFHLYATAAKAIKAHDPKIKVGGPGLAGNMEFLGEFLDSCREAGAPLDFLSWHQYTANPGAIIARAKDMRKALDQRGFTETESHLNEWHFFNGDWKRLRSDLSYAKALFEDLNGMPGAAFAANALLAMQDAPVDVANYYTGDTTRWGLFTEQGEPRKTYYSFDAFGELMKTPRRVACRLESPEPGLSIAAGTDPGASAAAMLVSITGQQRGKLDIDLRSIPWEGATDLKLFVLDAERDLVESDSEVKFISPNRFELSYAAPCVFHITLNPTGP